MKKIMVSATCLFLTCCATGYKQFYRPLQTVAVDHRAGPPPTEPLVDHTGLSGEDAVKVYASQGFEIIGVSAFQGGPNQADAGAVQQAKAVGADLVVISNPSYAGSRSTVIPITTPTSSTSYTNGSATAYGSGGTATAYGTSTTTTYGHQTNYIPVTTSRYEYSAGYFVKIKAKFGAFARDLTNAERQEIQSNHGVKVLSVINNSPAFEHDILVGDILLELDDKAVNGMAGWGELITQKAGQTVNVKIYRNGSYMAKDIKLNP